MPESMIEWLREAVEDLVEADEQLALALDGSLESIEALEAWLEEFKAMQERAPLTDAERFRRLCAAGAYLGEVIIAESGNADWALGEDQSDPWQAAVACRESDYQVYPMSKVLKRYENGAADSLMDFATLSIALFRGEIGFEAPTGALN